MSDRNQLSNSIENPPLCTDGLPRITQTAVVLNHVPSATRVKTCKNTTRSKQKYFSEPGYKRSGMSSLVTRGLAHRHCSTKGPAIDGGSPPMFGGVGQSEGLATFVPGALGFRLDGEVGYVVAVTPDSQAAIAGVEVEWKLTRVDEVPYAASILQQRSNGDVPYMLTCIASEAADDVSDKADEVFASSVGTTSLISFGSRCAFGRDISTASTESNEDKGPAINSSHGLPRSLS